MFVPQLAEFLCSHTRQGLAVFTLADGGSATFILAVKVSMASRELRLLWEREKRAADKRTDAHWEQVQFQQEELERLRDELGDAKARLARNEAGLLKATRVRDQYPRNTSSCRRSCGHCMCARCTACREYSTACTSTESKISTIEADIRGMEKLAPVLQPLPEDEDSALQVLFFQHMPTEFQSLSHLSFQAQQMLLPRDWDSHDAIAAAVERPTMDHWSEYYNGHQPVQPGQDGPVVLGYSGKEGRPETYVDRCTRPSHGIWHPDSLAPGSMLWKGGSFSADKRDFCFDPFSPDILSEWTTRAFTEQLSEEDRSLQWAMPQYGIGRTSPERGNLAIVSQSDAPNWLGKHQFLAFGGVRAYPLLQQRKLVLVLRDRSLPLGRPAVRTLVCQALYQIGELSTAPSITLLWRHDQDEVFTALFDELKVSMNRCFAFRKLIADIRVP